MTKILTFLSILFLFNNIHGQTSTIDFKIDSLGKIEWIVPFKGNEVKYKIERYDSGSFKLIHEIDLELLLDNGDNKYSDKDYLIVPLYNDTNKFRLTVNYPYFDSKEIVFYSL